MRVHWSTVALERVSEIADYLAVDDLGAAERWVDGLFAAAERLEPFPRSGRVVPELRREAIREVFYKRYRILYKVQPERVEVLTVRHMRQHLSDNDPDLSDV
ncbi:MAG: type II toxin-antitoxin system RelE/ParE family toxin [Bacteroidota bacterium]